jgi:hypothetical protein
MAKMRFTIMRLGQISLSLLLILGAANTFAGPGMSRYEGRELIRAFQVQNAALDRDQRGVPQNPPQAERQQGRPFGFPGDRYGAQNDSAQNPGPDNSRKQGRLTPEERRALRRQIDEVGHDIYAPRR